MKKYFLPFLLAITAQLSAQHVIRIEGKVTSHQGDPLVGVTIQIKETGYGTQTDVEGAFILNTTITTDSIRLIVSHVGFKEKTVPLLAVGQKLIIELEEDIELLDEVNIKGELQRDEVSVVRLEPKNIAALPSPFNDFNKILSTLPGVVSNNELSSTYSVRGGNFDENLVYVNDIPIYRPFLISNGQQEGLSFINTSLVETVSFSAGGWQPKYGDKLSSVLNVNYKSPVKFGASANLSLLGAGAHVEGITRNKRISYLFGIRHKSSQYLLNTLETEGQYLPRFTDFQSFTTFNLGPDKDKKKTRLELLTSYARNRYLVEPENRETEFGTFTQTMKLFVAFEGRELLEYDTYQGGLKFSHDVNEQWTSTLIASGVYAREREFTDVEGGYRLCDVDKNLGSPTFNECLIVRGIGTNYDYGRNRLNASIAQIENRNKIILNDKNSLEAGFGYTYQFIEDELNEYSFIDSADFVLVDRIVTVQADNNVTSNYVTGYIQHTTQVSRSIITTYGVRFNYLDLNDQFLASPRMQVSYRPDWVKDVLFKGSIGVYQQQPFYRELRNFSGEINRKQKAQESLHIIGGVDYNFRWWNRPFKFLGEVYYKKISDAVVYDIDNVKIRYYGENNAKAYAAGLDLRVSGEFIEGTESWFSLGIVNVREDAEGDGEGYIRRPTDQRVNVGVFFQDHLPDNPTFRVNLSLLFGSGLPFGPPGAYSQRNIFNGDAYRRVDIGFSKQIYLNKERYNEERWILITAEILNLLATDNPISYTWITDVSESQIAVPNSLSARFLNIKFSIKI